MVESALRHSGVLLYTDAVALASHRVRMVLADKRIECEIIVVDPASPPAEIAALGPTVETPVLIDRDLVLHDARVITDYLDERYPHPPLMPLDPVSRARTRLALHRIEQDWYEPAVELERAGLAELAGREVDPVRALRTTLGESLADANELFEAMPWFLSDEYSLLDAALAPLLWRLPHYGIVLPAAAAAVNHYARRLFARPLFAASLSPQEREMNA